MIGEDAGVTAVFVGGPIDGTHRAIPEAIPDYRVPVMPRPPATTFIAEGGPLPTDRVFDVVSYVRTRIRPDERSVVYMYGPWYSAVIRVELEGPECKGCYRRTRRRHEDAERLRVDMNLGSYECTEDGTRLPTGPMAVSHERSHLTNPSHSGNGYAGCPLCVLAGRPRYRSNVIDVTVCNFCGTMTAVHRDRHRITPYTTEELNRLDRERIDARRQLEEMFPRCALHVTTPDVCWREHIPMDLRP